MFLINTVTWNYSKNCYVLKQTANTEHVSACWMSMKCRSHARRIDERLGLGLGIESLGRSWCWSHAVRPRAHPCTELNSSTSD